ncbi:MAG: CBS domain-containing protein [Candidatus Coatesbacteria bacterium]|nr:CBS domain-containing protein [Candidatus Coatesbacteria bacterium]
MTEMKSVPSSLSNGELKAKDVMTREVVTVSPSTSLKALSRILEEHSITGAPVVDDEGRIVGIVSQTDVLFSQLPARIGNEDYDDIFDLFSASPEVGGSQVRHLRAPRWVEDIMTKHVVVASEDMSVLELASLLAEKGIHRVPVARNGKLVGIVSALDLLGALAKGAEEH